MKPVDEGSVVDEKEKLEQEFNHMSQKKLLALTETPANTEEVHPSNPFTLSGSYTLYVGKTIGPNLTALIAAAEDTKRGE